MKNMTDKNGNPLRIGDTVLLAGRHKNYLLRGVQARIIALQAGRLSIVAETDYAGQTIKVYLKAHRLTRVNP